MNERHIVVAGAGGNTGSHLLPHLARMPEISRLSLVDPDSYDEGNLRVQNIEMADIGRAKLQVQADKVRHIRPSMAVIAMQERIENVPRASLVCDLLVSCLDSKSARQRVNEISWRLGVPWIDCGVLGSQNLVRIQAYAPTPDAACLECGWGDAEYGLLEQEYLCGGRQGYPTMASSALGGLAASLLAIEIAKFLSGEHNAWAASKQVIVDAQFHTLQVTNCRRNPACRFDHQTWQIEPWPCWVQDTTVETLLNTLGTVQLEGHQFVHALVCPVCGRQETGLRLNRPPARCTECNRRMVSPGFDSLDCLRPDTVHGCGGDSLARIGLRQGDIVKAGNRYYRLAEAA